MRTGRTHFSGAISLETILRQTNHNMFFSKIEGPKCSLGTETENSVRDSVTQPKESKTVVLVKSSENQGDSPYTGRRPLFGAIALKTTQYYSKQTKTCFLFYKAESNAFQKRKSKNPFFCDIKLKAARFCCQHAKKRIFATMRLKKGYSEIAGFL